MADRKLTTAEILARARQQDAGDPAAESPAETAAPQETAPDSKVAEEQPVVAGPVSTGTPGATPKSTKDILAAARAQAGAGAASTTPTPKPPPATGGPPKSTKDILAAARAQAGGAAAAKTAAGPASPATPAATASGERPSVQEMLERARGKKPAETAKPQPALVIPEKPAPAKVRAGSEPRRSFLMAMLLSPFAVGWFAFTAASAPATLGMLRFMLPNVIVEPPSKFKIGSPDDYPEGTVTTKWKAEYAVWITNQNYKGRQEIYALSTVCTHLGCTPNWL
ncbi:MAG: ubiquinol-cytochrome c reductase iron-sulfur subunit, partial [Planctomycetaceae bacterium]